MGMPQREKVSGIDVVVEELTAAVEETPDPINDDDPSPKGNVMPSPLKDEAYGAVEAPGGEGKDTAGVDEMGQEKGGGVELTIVVDVELNIVGVVSIEEIKT